MTKLKISKRAMRLIKKWLVMVNRDAYCPFYRQEWMDKDERSVFEDIKADASGRRPMCRCYCHKVFQKSLERKNCRAICPCSAEQEDYVVRRVRAKIREQGED